MNSIMAGAQQVYPFEQWTNFNLQAAYAGVYPPPYEFNRSPQTSSGSDESMNNENRVDPKNSPKYREKRMKNNEAAKKSRLVRKQREETHQKENVQLKEKNVFLEKQNETLRMQLMQLEKTIRDLTTEREINRRRLEVLEAAQRGEMIDAKYPLGDITNHMYSNNPNKNYQTL
ncbi:unnamed protein product [Caenorhabditis sp. 36 PRJEB53466]|nr:unnamed protein product [Caenorhabditis sp. 36 PRJEB53466]